MPETEPRVTHGKQGWTDLLNLLPQGSIRHIQTISDRHPDTSPCLVDTLQLPRQSALVLLYPHRQKGDALWHIKTVTFCPFHSVCEKALHSPRTHKCLLGAYISLPPYRMGPLVSWQRPCYLHPQSLSLLCPGLAHDFIFTDRKCWDFLSHAGEIIWTKDPWWHTFPTPTPPPPRLVRPLFLLQ